MRQLPTFLAWGVQRKMRSFSTTNKRYADRLASNCQSDFILRFNAPFYTYFKIWDNPTILQRLGLPHFI